MSPHWHPRRRKVAACVQRDDAGRLWIRPRGIRADKTAFDLGWRLAATQSGPGMPEKEAIGLAIAEQATTSRDYALGIVAPGVLTVREFAEFLRGIAGNRKQTERVWLSRSKLWMPALGDLRLDAVTPEHVRAWWEAVQADRPRSPVYLSKVLGDVAAVSGEAFRSGRSRIDWFHEARISAPRDTRPARIQPLDSNRLRALFAALLERDQMAWAACSLLLATGMRPHELLGNPPDAEPVPPLAWDDIDGDAFVIDGDRAKGWTPRNVPVSPFAADVLDWLRSFGVEDTGAIIPGGKRGWLYESVRSALRSLGFKPGRRGDGTLYDLRSVAETVMNRSGVPRVVADQVLGHKTSPDTTSIARAYDRPFTDEAAAAVAQLGEFARAVAGWPSSGPQPAHAGTSHEVRQ